MIISRLPAALAVLGMLLAPIVRPAIAMSPDMMDMAGDDTAMGMPANTDMPCCQDEVPVQNCVKVCPFIALCMAGSVLNLPASAALLLPHKLVSFVFPASYANFTSLNHDPPLRPPKT